MALIGTLAINMVVNAKAFNSGVGSARNSLNSFAASIQTSLFAVGLLGTAGAVAIGKVVVASSNLEEQTDRTRDQFGKFAGQVIEQSNLLATAFGLAKKDTLESASVFSAIFESAGYAGRGVADLSVHFVKLATDLSRFANIPVKIAMEKIQSGLVGQVRPLREVGVSLSEAATDAYAYAHGIAAVGAELTDSQKIQSRAGFIADALAKSWGNLNKTGDKVAGAIEAVKGRFENLSATIGDSLLLIAAPALGEVQIGIQALQTAWLAAGNASISSSSASIEGLTAEHHTIGMIQQAIGLIADGWQAVGQSFSLFQIVVTAGIKAMVAGMDALINAHKQLANISTFGLAGFNIKESPLTNFSAQLTETLKAQGDAYEALAKAPWAHLKVNEAFDQGRKDIQAARDKLLKMGKLDVNSIKPTNALAALSGKEHKGFAHAAVFGESEATNAILNNLYGTPGQKNGAAEKTAQNTAQANVFLGQIARQFGAKGQGAANALFDAF